MEERYIIKKIIANKVFLLTALLAYGASVFGQETVQKFKAYRYFNEDIKKYVNSNGQHPWQDCNILVVIGQDKIKIYTPQYAELDIVKVSNRTENDDLISYDENVVDKLGIDALVVLGIYKNGMQDGYPHVTLTILYNDFVVKYLLWDD